MKKIKGIFCLYILLIIIACNITGCGQKRSDEDGKYNIYCLDRDENKLCSYEWECCEKDMDSLIRASIEQLKELPANVNYRQTIKDFDITEYNIADNQLILEVNEEYHNMIPTTEILVRAALVHTFCQLEGIDYVSIKCHGEALTDSMGIPVGKMNAELFVDNSGNEINSYESVRLTLYFADETGTKLKKVVRTVEYNSNIALEKLVIEQLIAGPNVGGYLGTINSQTKIINVTIKDGICYVSFDEGFINIPEGLSPEIMIYSIVNSLAELPNVNKVMINIDGSEVTSLGDNYNFETMYERNLELVE